jgi:predicted RNA-binding Zn ribbon-like protein
VAVSAAAVLTQLHPDRSSGSRAFSASSRLVDAILAAADNYGTAMPPTKRRQTRTTDKRLALNKRLVEIREEIDTLKRDRAGIQREEFEEMTRWLRELHKNTADLVTQLTRIGQLQAEVDTITRALVKAKLLD